MKKVFKYQMNIHNTTTVELPRGYQVLHFGVQARIPCIWVLVDPEETETIPVSFRLAGTGHSIDEPIKKYIGTILIEDGALVFHLFEMV